VAVPFPVAVIVIVEPDTLADMKEEGAFICAANAAARDADVSVGRLY